MTTHIFIPDHNLYCQACGEGELDGNHGMIPGPGGTPIADANAAVETTFTNVTITIALPPREAYDKLCALLAVGDLADWQTDKFKTTAYYMDEERKTSELFPVQD